ncbi:hypothetical protein BDK51DRAFT_25832 [Blyttiomyces helicus]|uniref:Uncharacterized protein n=1 Tax=Blyttiomyces helicus TaxID=388810 RepID=A0A4P9W916_9FUNG|nr:hypothetical protein BDK51DRAFT_25832 [Blyttiomyces helicus]|eukprot:RKO89031.1 hypothetical protein BDK51DRAFT_25832 [Blyttiomyces helicus]
MQIAAGAVCGAISDTQCKPVVVDGPSDDIRSARPYGRRSKDEGVGAERLTRLPRRDIQDFRSRQACTQRRQHNSSQMKIGSARARVYILKVQLCQTDVGPPSVPKERRPGLSSARGMTSSRSQRSKSRDTAWVVVQVRCVIKLRTSSWTRCQGGKDMNEGLVAVDGSDLDRIKDGVCIAEQQRDEDGEPALTIDAEQRPLVAAALEHFDGIDEDVEIPDEADTDMLVCQDENEDTLDIRATKLSRDFIRLSRALNKWKYASKPSPDDTSMRCNAAKGIIQQADVAICRAMDIVCAGDEREKGVEGSLAVSHREEF